MSCDLNSDDLGDRGQTARTKHLQSMNSCFESDPLMWFHFYGNQPRDSTVITGDRKKQHLVPLLHFTVGGQLSPTWTTAMAPH